MIGAVGLGVVALGMLLVLVQPQQAWQDAAEHSKRFWCAWALTFVTVGLVPSLAIGAVPRPDSHLWALVWLLVCCAGAVLQPALWTDVLETRRSRTRARHAPTLVSPGTAPVTAPVTLRGATAAPDISWRDIRWQAPNDAGAGPPRPDQTWMGTSA